MKRFLLVLFVLFSIHFWQYYRIASTVDNLTDLVSLLVFGYTFVVMVPEKGLRFKWGIILLLVGILCNILSAYFNNGQGIRDTLLTFGPYYFILIYFFLHQQKTNIKDLERLIIIFGILYAIFYQIQINEFPRAVFGSGGFRDRGTIRLRFQGSGFLVLGYFLLLNKFLINRKIINIVIALFLFFMLFKAGYRTLLAVTVLLTGILYISLINKSAINYLFLGVFVVLFIGIMQVGDNATILDGMINATEEQSDQGEDYIRLMQLRYFREVYPENASYYIFGGGLPGGKGQYAMRMSYIVENYGFYWVDLGMIGFYYVVGLVALLGILWYSFQALFTKLPSDYYYIQIFFAYLILSSITTTEIYRNGMLPIEAICLYIIDTIKNNNPSIVKT